MSDYSHSFPLLVCSSPSPALAFSFCYLSLVFGEIFRSPRSRCGPFLRPQRPQLLQHSRHQRICHGVRRHRRYRRAIRVEHDRRIRGRRSREASFFAWVIYMFARFLYGQQATSSLSATDVLGQSCRVTVAIPAGGLGQVRCRIGDELVDRIARSRSGEAIAENAPVRIEEVLGETVIVSRS